MRPSTAMSQKVLCLSEDVVKKCLDMKECLRINRQAFINLAQGRVHVPTRIGIPYRDPQEHGTASDDAADFTLFKPATIPDQNVMACKVVSIRQHNPSRHGLPLVPATIVSVDPPTGIVNGLVAGTYLTGARTATGSALSTVLYQPNVQRLVIFGAGLQAKLHVQALAAALERPIPHVTLINRTVARAQTLGQELMETTDWAEQVEALPLSAGDDDNSVADALAQADVIVTATNTTTPLFADSATLKTNCHICSVGSYTPQMQEIPPGIVDQCTVIYDTHEALAVGDLRHLTDAHPRHLLGNVLALSEPPPRDPHMPYTFFKSVGTAIQDACTTRMVMEKAREMKLGVEVDL